MVFAFDLDDTLYTEMDFVHSGYRAVASVLAGSSGVEAGEYYDGICRYRPVGFEWALEHYLAHGGYDTGLDVDAMIEIYRGHEPQIELRPGVRDVLCRLREAGHKLVLVTDGSTRHQRSKIRALDIVDYFDGILISEETGGDKTTSVPWTRVEQDFGAPGERFVYVGDNLSKDFRLPGLRGWTTVMSLDRDGVNVFGQHMDVWPPEYLPKVVMTDFNMLLNLK